VVGGREVPNLAASRRPIGQASNTDLPFVATES
jgi:hypothetical protein